MSQKDIVLKLCQNDPEHWFYSYEFCCKHTPYGWLGTAGLRRAFDLFQEGKLDKKDEGQYVCYKLKVPKTLF